MSNSVVKSDNSDIIKGRISNGEYGLALSRQQYLKHVEGTKQFNDYLKSRKVKNQTPQSKIFLSEKEAQQIIKKYSGTGAPKANSKGAVSNIEFVSTENIVGQYCKDGKWIDTKRVAIHHGKKSSHIVPVEELND